MKWDAQRFAGKSELTTSRTKNLVSYYRPYKTTLCSLVSRFYEPTQGEVRIDGMI